MAALENLSVSWNALLASTAGSVLKGRALTKDSSGKYVLATTANRALWGGRVFAVSLTAGRNDQSVRAAHIGWVPENILGPLSGSGDYVNVTADGSLARATAIGPDTIGDYNPDGSMLVDLRYQRGASEGVDVEEDGSPRGVFTKLNFTGAELTNAGGGKVNIPLDSGSLNVSGTGLVKATSGTVDAAASLLANADVASNAAIAGTKVDPNFGNQTVTTTGHVATGTLTAGTSVSTIKVETAEVGNPMGAWTALLPMALGAGIVASTGDLRAGTALSLYALDSTTDRRLIDWAANVLTLGNAGSAMALVGTSYTFDPNGYITHGATADLNDDATARFRVGKAWRLGGRRNDNANVNLLNWDSTTFNIGGAVVTTTLSSGSVWYATNNAGFSSGQTPIFRLQEKSSGDGLAFTIRGQTVSGSGGAGGLLRLQGGAKHTTGLKGGVALALDGTNNETMLHASEVASGRRVLALCQGAEVTDTQMPSNTGDRVTFVANRATAPTAPPVDGGILYAEGGAALWLSSSNTLTGIAP